MGSNEKLTEEFIRFLQLHNIQDKRQKKYRYSLKKINTMLGKDFTKATKEDIENLILQIDNSDYKEWTKHDYHVIVKKFWTWLNNKHEDDLDEWETPKIVKWIKIKPPRTAKKLPSELLTPKDIKHLISHCRTLREKALINTLYESGARIGELLNLKIKDINPDEYGCVLNLFGKTGYRKVRLVGSAPALSQWLELEHPKRNDPNSYVFCNTYKNENKDYRGNRLTHEAIYKILDKLKERSNFKKPLNPHMFRHSRATELSEHMTDAQRCNYFGWEQGSQVCRVYTHLQDTNRVVLEMNGLIEKDKDKNGKYSTIICPRCGNNNPFGSNHCSKCSLPLDDKTILEFDKQKDIAVMLPRVMTKEEFDKMVGEIMLQKLADREKA